MPLTLTELRTPKLLLCEGADEAFIFGQWFGERADLTIASCEGYAELRKATSALPSLSGVAERLVSLVVVADCDDQPAARQQSLEDVLQSLRGELPGVQTLSILVPDQGVCGSLETLFVDDISTPAQRECVSQLLACLHAQQPLQLTTEAQRDKIRLHVLADTLKPKDQRDWLIRRGALPLDGPRLSALRSRIETALN